MRIHISPLVDEYSRKKMCWDSASSKICPYILKDGSIQTNKFNYGILEIKLAKVFHYVHY